MLGTAMYAVHCRFDVYSENMQLKETQRDPSVLPKGHVAAWYKSSLLVRGSSEDLPYPLNSARVFQVSPVTVVRVHLPSMSESNSCVIAKQVDLKGLSTPDFSGHAQDPHRRTSRWRLNYPQSIAGRNLTLLQLSPSLVARGKFSSTSRHWALSLESVVVHKILLNLHLQHSLLQHLLCVKRQGSNTLRCAGPYSSPAGTMAQPVPCCHACRLSTMFVASDYASSHLLIASHIR